MSKGPPAGGMQDWFRAASENNSEYAKIATDPTLVGLVAARIRADGFTNRIPVMCSDHETGYTVRLSVDAGEVQVQLTVRPDMAEHDSQPQMLVAEKGMRLRAVCGECGKSFSDVNPVTVLRNAVHAIATMATRRPALRF